MTINRINEQITGVSKVRLVGDNVQCGVYSFQDAYKLADDMNLDLVEINRNQDPVICKILDYEKFLYQEKKNEKKQHVQEVKEIRLGPNIDTHDFEKKVKDAESFLKSKDKVKVSMLFKGREMSYTQAGMEKVLLFCTELESVGKVDKMPTLENRRITVLINPK